MARASKTPTATATAAAPEAPANPDDVQARKRELARQFPDVDPERIRVRRSETSSGDERRGDFQQTVLWEIAVDGKIGAGSTFEAALAKLEE